MFTETYLNLSPATKPLNNLTQFGLVVQTTSRNCFPTDSDGHSFQTHAQFSFRNLFEKFKSIAKSCKEILRSWVTHFQRYSPKITVS